jgi:uncharacterized Tic20 family protein
LTLFPPKKGRVMNFDPKDLLNFDKMITPTIIKVVYYLLMAIAVLAALAAIFGSLFSGGGVQGLIGGLIMLVLGPLAVRVYCEIMIVLFEIFRNLREINDRGRAKAGGMAPPQQYGTPPPPGWQ